jgi:hypothetical protein
MKKLFSTALIALSITPAMLKADVGEVDSTIAFTGVITAIESSRNSFTVQNDSGKVKMFTISAAEKAKLKAGERVTVNFTDAYQWPLKTTSIAPVK